MKAHELQVKKERIYNNQYLNRSELLHDITDYIGWCIHNRMHCMLDYE